jgi:hypothetical protein
MSEGNVKNVLDNFVSKPQTLAAERAGQAYFTDESTATIPNEGNMLSLLTMQKFYDGETEEEYIKAIATEENRYLIQAMGLVSGNGKAFERSFFFLSAGLFSWIE